ncbi:hypothetical protein BGZ83_006431 [Gryganskiella cystojenkinii]|nr:hypothetical protein BGZ83_006431 [Gryganskiella cystojenkinii]
MLDRAGIDYDILERSSEHRPLGSAISLNGTVLRLFEQLGLLEEIEKISRPAGRLQLLKEDLAVQGHIDLEHFKDRYGYYTVVMGRPDLHQLLISRIPTKRLHMGKRVLSTSQSEDGVLVRCQDNTVYSGDILVGCDGAYSSVRQLLHKKMNENGVLPKSDSKPLKFDQNCVVGITNELDPAKYPALQSETSTLYGIMGKKKPYIMWLIPIVGNRFAWSIGGRLLDSELGKDDVRSFSFAEWWPEVSTEVSDLVRDYALPDLNAASKVMAHSDGGASMSDTSSTSGSSCHSGQASQSMNSSNSSQPERPYYQPSTTTTASTTTTSSTEAQPGHLLGRKKTSLPAKPGTVAEIIDATPADRISKVMLESKFFKAWYYERTVLLGDACHKVLPFAGQGAIQAILDAISLANALYDMKDNTMDQITKAFKRYTNERASMAKNAVLGSQTFGKILDSQGPITDLVRKYSFNHVPSWLLRMSSDKLHQHRPQLVYLPMVPDRGTAPAQAQEYSPKYLKRLEVDLKEFQNRQAEAAVVKAAAAAVTVRAVSRERELKFEHLVLEREGPREARRSSTSKHRSRSRVSQRGGTPTLVTNHGPSDKPPPLPKVAAPRHHPTIYVQYNPEPAPDGGHDAVSVGNISGSSSTCSTPTSSAFSLTTQHLGPIADAAVDRQSRSRRRSLTSLQQSYQFFMTKTESKSQPSSRAASKRPSKESLSLTPIN